MRHSLVLITLLACSVGSVFAQSSFNDIIRSAIANDRNIKARQAKDEAALTFNDISGPEIEFEHQWHSKGEYPYNKWMLGISQDFDWPGLYAARSKVAGLERENASLVLLAIRADEALSVKQLIIDIINSHRRRELYCSVARNLAVVDSLTKIAYERGNATVLDLWKMKLAVLENKYKVATAESDIRALEGNLVATGAQFVNGEEEFWHEYPIQPLIDPSDADCNSLAEAIMRNSASLGVARAKAMKLEAVPGFSLGYIHAYEEDTHFNGLRVGLRLPSFSQKKKNKAALLQAEAIDFAASYEVDKQRAEFQALYEEARTLSAAMDGYRELTGDDSYLHLLDKAYKAGQITVIDYLNEINMFIGARIDFLDLEYRYNLALARLNRYRSIDF